MGSIEAGRDLFARTRRPEPAEGDALSAVHTSGDIGALAFRARRGDADAKAALAELKQLVPLEGADYDA